MKITTFAATLALLSPAILLAGCDDDEGSNNDPNVLELRIWGEPFVDDGIPAEEFVDGWAVEFNELVVSVTSVEIGSQSVLTQAIAIDLASSESAGGVALPAAALGNGSYTEASYRIAPIVEDATAINASAETITAMRERGASVYVDATATRGESTKQMRLFFDTDTLYSPCEIDLSFTGGDEGTAEMTIHADHFFYDSLVSDEPGLAFDVIADADEQGDADGIVTEEELSAYDITALEDYQVGNFDIDNLYDYLAAQTATLGHINGEGHCDGE